MCFGEEGRGGENCSNSFMKVKEDCAASCHPSAGGTQGGIPIKTTKHMLHKFLKTKNRVTRSDSRKMQY